jgi:hypothetical protein
MSFHVPETRRVQDPRYPEYHSSARDGNNGAFLIHLGALKFFCIASDGGGWEHVSITLRTGVERCPTWEEMCKIKAVFWDEDDAVIQIHPKKSDYVTMHPTCLHLWRCTDREQPLPHYAAVGPLKGQTIREAERAFEKEVSV